MISIFLNSVLNLMIIDYNFVVLSNLIRSNLELGLNLLVTVVGSE